MREFGSARRPICAVTFHSLGGTPWLLACTLVVSQANAETAQQQEPSSLPGVTITRQRERTAVRRPGRAPQPKRVAVRRTPQPQSTPPLPQTVQNSGAGGSRLSGGTPLNSQAVTEVGSKLDLTAREIPATVQVVDRQTIEERGYHTVTEALHGIPGVTSGNPPGEPVAIAMRGLSNDQLNVQYNGIRLNQVSSRPMDTFNLDRVEVIKGPASLISGEGATGGVINYVTKSPHTGPVENEAFVSYDSLHSLRGGIGSGGSTSVQGLDYRFDVSRSLDKGFIEDTHTNNFDISSQLNYRVTETFKVFGAVEYRNDDISPYWGTPLVSAAFSGPNALNGIVSGNYVSRYNGTDLGAVTIDRRTLTTNYNVLDHYMTSNDR
jgi:iron complex outermembrane receptor protein